MFSLVGRASRKTFWLVLVVTSLLQLVIVVLNVLAVPALLLLGMISPSLVTGVSVLMYILLIPIWWVSIATTAKRFHDRGKSGWWVLIGLVPVIGFFWTFIECGFLRGTTGANQYGDDPLSGSFSPQTPVGGEPSSASLGNAVSVVQPAQAYSSVAAPQPASGGSTALLWGSIAALVFLGVAFFGYKAWSLHQKSLNAAQLVSDIDQSQSGAEQEVAAGNEPSTGVLASSSVPTGKVTATFTVDGLSQTTIKGGQKVVYAWSTTNANDVSSSVSVTGCANPVYNSQKKGKVAASGSTSETISSEYKGCTFFYTLEAKNTQTEEWDTAQATIYVE